MLGGYGNVILISGVIVFILGIVMLIVVFCFGWLGDCIGSECILIIGLILVIFVYLLMVFV